MASASRAADSALYSLWHQCRQIAPPVLFSRPRQDYDPVERAVYSLWHRIESFENEFRCVRIFLDCIHKWSDLECVLRLKRPQHLCSPFPMILRMIDDRSLKGKVSKLDDLFSGLMSEVMDLKPEIRKAYDSLRSHSFRFRFDYDHWNEFGEFVGYYEGACSKRANCYKNPLNEQFRELNRNLVLSTDFLDSLAKSSFNSLKIKDAMAHVGRVAISAALRFCEWWAGGTDPEIVRITLLELQQKIDVTNPEFVEMNLKLLTVSVIGNRRENQVDKFVKCLFLLREDFPRHLLNNFILRLHRELKSLVISIVKSPMGDAENVQMLLADVVLVLTKVGKVSTISEHSNHLIAEAMLQNLLPEIWLIKLEIFLRNQLHTYPILQMPTEKLINALNKGLRFLNYEEWLKFLKTPIRYSSEENIVKGKRILTLMEEVGKVVASLDNFIHARNVHFIMHIGKFSVVYVTLCLISEKFCKQF